MQLPIGKWPKIKAIKLIKAIKIFNKSQGKMKKILVKVREFRQRKKVGTGK